jgi:signal transduction histidine kinase
MSELRIWLETRQADLVTALQSAVADSAPAKPLSRMQVSAFVLAVAAATEQGMNVLEDLLRQWHAEESTDDRSGGWMTMLLVLRQTMWAHIIAEFSPARALHHLKSLDGLLSATILLAAELDCEGRVRDHERVLEEARERLQQLDRSKSSFIKIAAHELKTPLTLIDGYAKMLMAEIPEPARSRTDILLGGIANGTRRLGEIIEGMIDVSMIDTRVLEISFQPLYLRQVVKTVVEDLATVLRIRQIELTVDPFPEDGAPTFGDNERLYQAIYNVVGNGIKFTPDNGQIRIRNQVLWAQKGAQRERGRYLKIEISDTGIGIAPENLERIFGKLVGLGTVALHSTGKFTFKGGGPGLGLSISRGILEAHGGEIWAESDGHDEIRLPGSTFHLLIPLYDEPPTPAA